VAFDRALTEGIFPMDPAGCDADIGVFVKAWGVHLCRATGSMVHCAAAEQLEAESSQLLSDWVYSAGRHRGEGPTGV